MSAVPKKKLCWNCEGNVSRQVDNCPYCGVYLHGSDIEEDMTLWNPSYQPSGKTEEIPTPIYQINQESSAENSLSDEEEESSETSKEVDETVSFPQLISQLKRDVFPILFLMMGSIFFLFGTVLYLFSSNGTLTLQWQGDHAPYFLLFAIPLVGLGAWFHKTLDSDE